MIEEKVKVFGLISAAMVVVLKIPPTQPIVRLTDSVVELFGEESLRTCTVCQTLTVPALAVNTHPSILYSPQTTEILTGTLIPCTVIELEA